MSVPSDKIDTSSIWFDHQTLIRKRGTSLLTVYDQSAQGVLDLANSEGYFEGVDPDLLKWPPSRTPDGPIGLEGLGYRAKLIGAIYEGVPQLRDQRMGEAYDQIRRVAPDYYQAVQLYARVREQFLQTGQGATAQFLERYQSIYVEELRASNVFTPDEGEAALAGARLSPRAPVPRPARRREAEGHRGGGRSALAGDVRMHPRRKRNPFHAEGHIPQYGAEDARIPGRRRTARRTLQHLYKLRLVRMRGVEDHQRRRAAGRVLPPARAEQVHSTQDRRHPGRYPARPGHDGGVSSRHTGRTRRSSSRRGTGTATIIRA